MKEYINILKRISDDYIIMAVEKNEFIYRDYEADNVIHLQEELCVAIDVIVDGMVRVERLDEDGETLTISDFYRGDVLGGNLIFSGNPRYPMIITAKRKTRILSIKREILFEMLQKYPEFLGEYLRYMSDHSAILANTIRYTLGSNLRQRILNYLNYMKDRKDNNTIELEFSKKELALRLGVQRTSLSRELSKMKDEGIIEYDRKSITLL